MGLIHKDINSINVLVVEMDHAILINFDSGQQGGRKLGVKASTRGPSMEGSECASFKDNDFSLSAARTYAYVL